MEGGEEEKRPAVIFNAVIFLPTEQQIDRFAEIVQNIAQKIVMAFYICENPRYTFVEKDNILKGIKELEKDLPDLLMLAKMLKGQNLEPSDPYFQKFNGIEDLLEKSIQNAQHSFKEISDSKKALPEDRVGIYKALLSELLGILKLLVQLLQLQDEFKVRDIVKCAQYTLTFVKQIRDGNNREVIEKLYQNGKGWVETLKELALQRSQVISDEGMKIKLQEGANDALNGWENLRGASLLDPNRSKIISQLVEAVAHIVEVTQGYIEISSNFIMEAQSFQAIPREIVPTLSTRLDKLLDAVKVGDNREAISLLTTIVNEISLMQDLQIKETAKPLVPLVRKALQQIDSNDAKFSSTLTELEALVENLKKFEQSHGQLLSTNSQFLEAATYRTQQALQKLLVTAQKM